MLEKSISYMRGFLWSKVEQSRKTVPKCFLQTFTRIGTLSLLSEQNKISCLLARNKFR